MAEQEIFLAEKGAKPCFYGYIYDKISGWGRSPLVWVSLVTIRVQVARVVPASIVIFLEEGRSPYKND